MYCLKNSDVYDLSNQGSIVSQSPIITASENKFDIPTQSQPVVQSKPPDIGALG